MFICYKIARMVELWISLALFAGIFLQGIVGFGMALIAMPLLASVSDISTITPVIALSGNLAKILILIVYRKEVQYQDFRQIAG
jgi:uncharacterized membrane protein YfcA